MNASIGARILATIVLYKTAPEQSAAFYSLAELARQNLWIREQVECLLYDNSPEEQNLPPSNLACRYIHDSSNPGLARPYNLALQQASDLGIPWLLLLDQDTALTEAYLREMLSCAQACESDPRVAALVPKLVEEGRALSPHGALSDPVPLAGNFHGLAPEAICAFNSGAVLRVADLLESGGFQEDFPLDYLDHVTFHQLQSGGKRVYVLAATLQHHLSLTNPSGFQDPSFTRRYWASFIAEERFHRRFSSPAEFRSHLLGRLRTLGWLLRGREWKRAFKHARLTLGF